MEQSEQIIDQVLVHLFNDLLRIEERTLQRQCVGVSIREVHVIAAVCGAREEENTMTALAAALRVTLGSLTVAVATLERKGYVQRQRSQVDRRRIHVVPLPPAMEVDRIHRAFHERMVAAVREAVPGAEMPVFVQGLQAVNDYFYGQEEISL